MICPQTKDDCPLEQCQSINRCIVAPPKPTMEDIERLVDAHNAARAALMAAIRAYGEG